jgi:putative copper resistance protein D
VETVDPLVVAQIAVAAAQDVLFALAAGALVCGAMLRRQDTGRLAALGRTRLGALCVLALTCVLYLWLEAAVMSGSPFSEAGAALSAVLTQSHFGIAWSVGFADGTRRHWIRRCGARPSARNCRIWRRWRLAW